MILPGPHQPGRRAPLLALLALLALPVVQAFAACSISSVGSISFGNYSVFTATPVTSTGSFSVANCQTTKRSYTVTLSAGSSASFSARSMAKGSDTLQYNLYTDSAFSTVWPDTGTAVSGTGATGSSGTAKTVYGRIPAGQDVPAGDYADSVTITISF